MMLKPQPGERLPLTGNTDYRICIQGRHPERLACRRRIPAGGCSPVRERGSQ